MSVIISFFLTYYIYLGISLETRVFWLGSFLILVKNLETRGCDKNVLERKFKKNWLRDDYSWFESKSYSWLCIYRCPQPYPDVPKLVRVWLWLV